MSSFGDDDRHRALAEAAEGLVRRLGNLLLERSLHRAALELARLDAAERHLDGLRELLGRVAVHRRGTRARGARRRSRLDRRRRRGHRRVDARLRHDARLGVKARGRRGQRLLRRRLDGRGRARIGHLRLDRRERAGREERDGRRGLGGEGREGARLDHRREREVGEDERRCFGRRRHVLRGPERGSLRGGSGRSGHRRLGRGRGLDHRRRRRRRDRRREDVRERAKARREHVGGVGSGRCSGRVGLEDVHTALVLHFELGKVPEVVSNVSSSRRRDERHKNRDGDKANRRHDSAADDPPFPCQAQHRRRQATTKKTRVQVTIAAREYSKNFLV
eukprot:Opistho-1_new@96390